MAQQPKTILIAPRKEGCLLSSDFLIRWEQTNFPSTDFFTIKANFHDFLKVEMLQFDQASKQLTIRLLAIIPEAKGLESFYNQRPKFRFSQLRFMPTNWTLIEPLFSFCQPHAFQGLAEELPTKMDAKEFFSETNFEEFPSKSIATPTNHDLQIPFDFHIPFKKLIFKTGYVECRKRIKPFKRPVTFRIPNDHLLSEFEHIKGYFSKKLDIKQVRVTGVINQENRGNGYYKAQSENIQNIDEHLIHSIRLIQMKKAIQKPKVLTIDKSLFNPDEYFDRFEPNLGNTISNDQQQLLEDIFQLEVIRNRKQLQYLAGKLHHAESHLRFTLTPKFGFLFLVRGQEMDHFIWELLNTNATYIWSMDKDHPSLNRKYDRIEQIINGIREHGRMQYISSEKSQDLLFHRITHKHANAALKASFPRWKAKIEEKLI
ncbi:MAG: hypothetical protein AAF598_17445 [Bacteroidota bacterium]